MFQFSDIFERLVFKLENNILNAAPSLQTN